MGFRSAITPTRLATNAELVLDDTRNYNAGATAEFQIPPELFGGFDPVRFELIADPTFAWMRGQVNIYPPDIEPNGVLNASLFHSMITDFRSMLPIQPIGGHLVLSVRNLDGFGGDLRVRALRLRGVRDFSDLLRSALDGPQGGVLTIPAGNTVENGLKGSAVIADRVKGLVTLDQTYDVVARWRDASFNTMFTIDEDIATGVAAGTPTFFDVPYFGAGNVQIRVTNTSGSAASGNRIYEVLPRL